MFYSICGRLAYTFGNVRYFTHTCSSFRYSSKGGQETGPPHLFHEVDYVAAENFCDPAFVDQETMRDAFAEQICRYHLHDCFFGIHRSKD
ncbi:UNVERIFIED_CONTAM: hypothetical protein NCL1_41200 [Trichonephila clavipes]